MADWRIVTPTRAPMDDEIFGVGYIVLSPGKISIMYSSSDEMLSIMFQNVQPVVRYYYDFSKKEWQDESFSPIDITTVDLTVPESAISSATTKTSYFDLIAFEKGTTACKLAVANEAKTLIRNALINTGVDVPDTTPFRQYAGKVGEIQSGVSLNGRILKAYSNSASGSGTVQLEEEKKYVIFLNMVDSRNYARFSVRVYAILEPGTLSLQNEYKNSSFAGQFVFTLDGNNLNYSHYTDYYIFDFVVIEQ